MSNCFTTVIVYISNVIQNVLSIQGSGCLSQLASQAIYNIQHKRTQICKSNPHL